ncbi:alpha-L-fucosidase [Algibacter mikhailovii]|uniref:alpha-L-fucosidase n=1 Tax=Algibacter mikhailovii TaxID=425498 RepID=UPI0024952A3A|nr:alpha-L-fucosidase [Algibacter mikhailovii]
MSKTTTFNILIFMLLCTVNGFAQSYEPTRQSLSNYEVPEWYKDAKIGLFYHWGPGSVPGLHFNKDVLAFCRQKGVYKDSGTAKRNPPGQWGANMYPKPGLPDNEQNSNYLLHKRFFGDPKEFGYKELIPLLTGAKFDPKKIVNLVEQAGIKYIVPMAVHHDGFAMWDSKVIDEFNAMKMGPKRNTTKEIIDEARLRGMKVGVSTHVARHSWYYSKTPGYDVSDPRYVQLYGEGSKNGLPTPEAIQKWEDTMEELVDTFHPDYIFVDGGTADIYTNEKSYVMNDAFRRIVSNYYNTSLEAGVEPVLTFKRESLWKEEAVPDYEGGFLSDIAPYTWQTHFNNVGWFYRPGQNANPSHINFRKMIDAISKNGNVLLNIALRPDGSIQEEEVQFYKDLGAWTSMVGEGIYGSRPWLVYGEFTNALKPKILTSNFRGKVYEDPEAVPMGAIKLNKADIRYTRSKDNKSVYATILAWPKEPVTLTSFSKDGVGKSLEIKNITLLGSDEIINWKHKEEGIVIKAPSKPVFSDQNWPVTFKLNIR